MNVSRYELYRRIPDWIEQGLEDGSLQMGPGGVIRHRIGVNEDSIAAIVRTPSPNGSTLMTDRSSHPSDLIQTHAAVSRSAAKVTDEQQTELTDIASQIASAVDLYVAEIYPGSIAVRNVISDVLNGFSLARIDDHLQQVEHAVSSTLDMVQQSLAALRDLGDLQFVSFTTEVERGVELLQRGLNSGDSDYFVRAVKRLEEGIADVRTVLRTMDGERMLENAFRTQHLLRIAALCASGEMQAMALTDKSLETRVASLKTHQSLWKDVHFRLCDIPGPASRLPTLAMLQTQKEHGLMRTRQQWIQESRRMIDILQAESAFLTAMQSIPESELGATSRDGSKSDSAVLCLVNRDSVPSE